jgi:hypothetical protein
LSERPKSDPAKLAIAARLRRETTLTLPWFAARRHPGTWKSLNAKLHRWRKTNESPAVTSRLLFDPLNAGDGQWFYNSPPTPKFGQLRSVSMDQQGNLLIVENDLGYVRRIAFQRLTP